MKAKSTVPQLCKYLRARNPYGMPEGGENPWYLLDDANTMFWCIRTAGGTGPDYGLVAPGPCQNGRSCFTKAEEAQDNL